MKTIRNIIFDFDGTLADTTPLIIATMHRTISKLGLSPKTYAECRATIGLRLEEIPSVLWPGEAAAKEFAATYRLIFDQLERPLPVKCFPGVIDTIKKLHQRGFGMAIASSRNRASLLEYAELFGIKDFRLESALGHPVIIIPWTLHGDFHADDTDKYGHADGFIKWCGGNRILIGNHGDTYPNEAEAIRCQLEDYGFVVTEMGFKDKVKTPCTELNWAYINFLQVGQEIIMPKLNIEEDAIAYDYIQNAFPNCHISQIEMTELVREGGALHCISWNIIK